MAHHLVNLLVVMEIFAALSIFASLLVLATMVAFREMRGKLFMRIIAYISLSDLLGNFPYLLPYRPHHGPWCVMQGLLNITFYPMSWLWTLALAYLLYYLATQNKFPPQREIQYISATCWGLPVFLTALSVSCTQYGYSTFGKYSYEVCIFRRSEAAVIYHGIFYYGLLLLSWILMILMKRRLVKLEVDTTAANGSLPPSYQVAKTSLSLYPPALIICWLPHCILFFVGFVVSDHSRGHSGLYFLSDVLKLFHGVVTAAIFFYKSPEARRLWWKLYYGCIGKYFNRQKGVEENRISGADIDLQIQANFAHEAAQASSPEVVNTLHEFELSERG